MSTYYFKYYLHDSEWDSREDLAQAIQENEWTVAEPFQDGTEAALTPEIIDEIADALDLRPFYEVEFWCEYDSETKQINVLNTKRHN